MCFLSEGVGLRLTSGATSIDSFEFIAWKESVLMVVLLYLPGGVIKDKKTYFLSQLYLYLLWENVRLHFSGRVEMRFVIDGWGDGNR